MISRINSFNWGAVGSKNNSSIKLFKEIPNSKKQINDDLFLFSKNRHKRKINKEFPV